MTGKKGISAMIATVLLIAFTVAVGGILSIWLTSLTNTQTESTGTAAERQVLCARSVLGISEVTSKFGSGTDMFNITVVYNYGTEDLYYFNITFVDDMRNSLTVTPNIGAGKNFNKTNPLQPGMMQVFNINTTDTTGSVERSGDLSGASLYSVRVRAICQENYPVVGECKAGQACLV